MVALLTEHELNSYLTGFRTSAFRFEIRDRYNSAVGRESFRRYCAGEPDDYAWHQSWLEMLRRDTAQGKIWRRVRIVTVPLSPWAKYGLEVARLSVEAGDDTRYLARDTALSLGITPFDAWLFDNELLAHLHFDDEDDSFLGVQIIADDKIVQQHRKWRDLAWKHAQTLEDFTAALT
jgi:hypothetical protein